MGSRTNRRRFVQSIGAGMIAGGFPFISRKSNAQVLSKDDLLNSKPNLLFIITDQTRYPQHWPTDFLQNGNFPCWNRLQANGVTFRRAYCNTAMCSPSRATLFTGLHPAQHGMVDTLTESETFEEKSLPTAMDFQNMARMLGKAGYHVVYKGKWHLSEQADQTPATAQDLENYGFHEWDTREAGQTIDSINFGIRSDVDPDYTESAVQFLENWSSRGDERPFALFVSLVNPHDVLAYPGNYNEAENGVYDYLDNPFSIGIELPPTVDEDLSNKPLCQRGLQVLLNTGLGRLITQQQKLNYVNFYAQLQIESEALMDRVMGALEANGFGSNTVTFRLSDHGELGLSHNGLRQKAFNMYEETVNVPLFIHNPLLFPNGGTTSDSLASLIDIMPTVAELAHASDPDQVFRGRSLMPIVHDPAAVVNEALLFTFDDQRAANTMLADPTPQPNHIRAIIKGDEKYAVYFNPYDSDKPEDVNAYEELGTCEFEWYSRSNDPYETDNIASQSKDSSALGAQENALREELLALSQERLAALPQESFFRHWKDL